MGIGYRLNRRELPGTPDLAFIGRGKVIFVHGCFWHQHGCQLTGKVPSTRSEYWAPKLQRNVERDAAATERLKKMGYGVLIVWECEVGDARMTERIGTFLERKKPRD